MDTTAIQRALIALGYDLGPSGADGVAGPKTRLAVTIFQRGRGLAADGIAGPLTIKALQAAIAAKGERPAAAVMTVSIDGRAEILSHEAIVTSPYKDSVGVWTIGVGHTKAAGSPDPAALPKGVARPVAEMIALFEVDLSKYEAEVRRAVTIDLRQHEFDALVSFHFNTGAIGRASLVKLLNDGDRVGAARGFMSWSKPPEIVERRRKEQALFRDGRYSHDGKASVYPASASGSVQWGKGKRVPVMDLIGDI